MNQIATVCDVCGFQGSFDEVCDHVRMEHKAQPQIKAIIAQRVEPGEGTTMDDLAKALGVPVPTVAWPSLEEDDDA